MIDHIHRPICVGYVRSCPTCQDVAYQREQLTRWFLNHEAADYEFGGWYEDKPKAPDEMRRKGRKKHASDEFKNVWTSAEMACVRSANS